MNFFMHNMKNRYSDPDPLFPNVDQRIRIRIHVKMRWIRNADRNLICSANSPFPSKYNIKNNNQRKIQHARLNCYESTGQKNYSKVYFSLVKVLAELLMELKFRKIIKPMYTFSLRLVLLSAYKPRQSWVRVEQTYAFSCCNLRNHNLKMVQEILFQRVQRREPPIFFTILHFNQR